MLFKKGLFLVIIFSLLGIGSCKSAAFKGRSDVKDINGAVPIQSPKDISQTINENDRYGKMQDANKTTPKPGGTTPPDPTNPDDPGKLDQDFNEEKVVFTLDCGEQDKVISYSNSKNTRVIATIEGKVCATTTTENSTSSMNVVFVVDYSASMGPSYEEDGVTTTAGHDPLQGGSLANGTCGRLQGAQAVINQLMSKYSNEQVYVSFVGFATEAVTTITPRRIDTFKSKYLNAEVFCRYVKQPSWTGSDAGFIPNTDNSASGTNYIDALNRATDLLKGNKKPSNQVYFITDGEQSRNIPGKNITDDAAIKAADGLRASVLTATINAIYLNANLSDSRSQTAINVLTEIARSSDRVKSVSSAADLANSLDDFEETQVLIKTSDYPKSAVLSVPSYADINLGIQSIKANEDNTVWTYRTQPFYLVTTKTGSTPNKVLINLQSTEGTSLNNSITINYSFKD